MFSYGDVDGKGYDAKLQHPLGLAWNSKTQTLYVCDTYNHKIKQVEVKSNFIHSLPIEKSFNEPSGCCLDPTGNILYVADTNNHRIKKINLIDNQISELEISEQTEKTENINFWDVGTEISENGGSITLKVKLQPDDVHGRWKLEFDDRHMKADCLKGEVKEGMASLEVKNLPSNEDSVFKIIFDLVLCQNDACLLRKYILRVFIKRTKNAIENQIINFAETVR